MNRRTFLQTSFAGVTGAVTALRLNAAGNPDVSFPTAPRERLAVASYPFRKSFGRHGKMTLLDFPKFVVEQYNVPGIEPLDEHFASTEPAYLEKFRKALDDAKAHVVNVPVGRVHGSFYDPDAAKRKVAVETAKKWVDVAVVVGSPSVRNHIQGGKGFKPDSTLAAEALKQVADYGAEKNVVVHLENDDAQTEEAFFLLDIIAKAGTPWLRALPDFCNSMLLGRGEDYNYKAMSALFEHAYGICHVKDSEQDGKKMYHIDMAKTFGIAKAANYRGYFSMEFDADADAAAPTKELVETSLKLLS